MLLSAWWQNTWIFVQLSWKEAAVLRIDVLNAKRDSLQVCSCGMQQNHEPLSFLCLILTGDAFWWADRFSVRPGFPDDTRQCRETFRVIGKLQIIFAFNITGLSK